MRAHEAVQMRLTHNPPRNRRGEGETICYVYHLILSFHFNFVRAHPGCVRVQILCMRGEIWFGDSTARSPDNAESA